MMFLNLYIEGLRRARVPDWVILSAIVFWGSVFLIVVIFGAVRSAEEEGVRRKVFNAYMVDCVLRLTEARCQELWRWRGEQ